MGRPPKIGQYLIQRKLGAGGMGEVWLALDPRLDRQVAIKVLPEGFGEDRQQLQRFLREARLCARLQHPNVVRVYQAGMDGRRPFIVMQYVDGSSLDQLVARDGPLGWPEATRIIRDAAAGLGAAHELGLVHRDIKPANLIRSSNGTTKVVDFGLARMQLDTSGLTQCGTVRGTPGYMPPEQWLGQEVSAQSDWYSLACTFYFLLTGEPPFSAPSVPALGYLHRRQPLPDPRERVLAIPEALCRILNRGANKNPADRYTSAAELIAALDEVISGGSGEKEASSRLRCGGIWEGLWQWCLRKRRWIAAAACGVLALAVLFTCMVRRSTPPVPEVAQVDSDKANEAREKGAAPASVPPQSAEAATKGDRAGEVRQPSTKPTEQAPPKATSAMGAVDHRVPPSDRADKSRPGTNEPPKATGPAVVPQSATIPPKAASTGGGGEGRAAEGPASAEPSGKSPTPSPGSPLPVSKTVAPTSVPAEEKQPGTGAGTGVSAGATTVPPGAKASSGIAEKKRAGVASRGSKPKKTGFRFGTVGYSSFPAELTKLLDHRQEQLKLAGGQCIAGRIIDEDGRVPSGLLIFLVNSEGMAGETGAGGAMHGSSVSAVQQSPRFEQFEGGWFIQASVWQQNVATRGVTKLVVSSTENVAAETTVKLMDRRITYLELVLGATAKESLGKIEARLLDEQDKPLQGKVVYLAYPGDVLTPTVAARRETMAREATTDENGRFQFEGLAPTEHRLVLAEATYGNRLEVVRIAPGATEQLLWKLYLPKLVEVDYAPLGPNGTFFNTQSTTWRQGLVPLSSDVRLYLAQQRDQMYLRQEPLGRGNQGCCDAGVVPMISVRRPPATGYSLQPRACTVGHVYVVRGTNSVWKFVVRQIANPPEPKGARR